MKFSTVNLIESIQTSGILSSVRSIDIPESEKDKFAFCELNENPKKVLTTKRIECKLIETLGIPCTKKALNNHMDRSSLLIGEFEYSGKPIVLYVHNSYLLSNHLLNYFRLMHEAALVRERRELSVVFNCNKPRHKLPEGIAFRCDFMEDY